MNDEGAELVAIQALGFIAGEDELLTRFLGLTGVEPGDVRGLAGETAFQVAVLDFLAGNEPDLLRFADHAEMDPEAVIAARHRLAGPDHAGYD